MKKFLFGFIFALFLNVGISNATPSLLLGINEGTAEQHDVAKLQEKYQVFANYLSRTLKKPIKIESSQILNSSNENLKKRRYDLFFSKPSNVAAKAMKEENYSLIASAKGSFTVQFIVNKSSALKLPQDTKGKRFAIAQGTFMEKAGMATLRDLKLTPPPQQIQHAKFQEAIAYMVEKGFAEIGIVSPVIGTEWKKNGGRVLFESKKLPFWSIIASSHITPSEVAKLRETLIEMENSAEGKTVLEKIGIKGFVAGNKQEYLDLLTWIEE